MKEETKILKLNAALTEALDMDPETIFAEPMTEMTARMKYGLAQVYANEGFREYMQWQINRALKDTATKSITLVDVAAGKARALIAKKLLADGKQAFQELQKIQQLTKK